MTTSHTVQRNCLASSSVGDSIALSAIRMHAASVKDTYVHWKSIKSCPVLTTGPCTDGRARIDYYQDMPNQSRMKKILCLFFFTCNNFAHVQVATGDVDGRPVSRHFASVNGEDVV